MALDFAAVREGRLSYVDAVGNVTPAALRTATADLYSTIEGIIAGLSDDEVVFQPVDPDAHDQFAITQIAKATVDKDGKIQPPAGTSEELQKYLELKPDGPYAQSAKDMLTTLTGSVQTTYVNPNAPKKGATKKK